MVVIAAVLLASCLGFTTEATKITKQPNGSYSAQLNFVGSCGAGEHCSWYVRYRRVGTSVWSHVPATPHGPVAGPVSKVALSEKVIGLAAGAQYEYQVCGNAQPGQQFACVGRDGTPHTTTKFTTPAAPSVPTWSLQSSANQMYPTGVLFATSCSSATACTAVGYYVNNIGTQVTLAEAWNGSAWRIQSTPNPSGATASYLWGVSCTSATACTAVGHYTDSNGSELTLAERWNGTTWTIQPTPGEGRFNSVSCTSTMACTAVGGALAERWNGSTWTIQTTPSGTGTLNGVSCTTTTACMAVGWSAGGPLAEVWDGNTWTIRPTPSGTGTLNGVSCTSATACTAVGNSTDSNGYHPLAERWDGTSWTTQAISNLYGGYLYGVSCASATACAAVGSDASVTLAWNGSTWTLHTSPSDGSLNGVSCTSTTACTAVGDSAIGPLAERWNGSAWRIQAGTILKVFAFSSLSGVSCVSTVACTAVGYAFNYPDGEAEPMAQRWDGRSWTMQTISNQYGGQLFGVSCTSVTACTAVGSSANQALAERWNGSTWTIQPPANLSFPAASAGLGGVSCLSASACTAVGDYAIITDYAGDKYWETLAERWNGTTWTIENTPRYGNNGTNHALSAVSCTSATACIAVGTSFTASSSSRRTLAERWNGNTWTAVTTPNPSVAAGPGSALAGVSCTTASACTAVGYSYVGNTQEPLAERWNGTSWIIQTTPKPSGGGSLSSVSCTAANACTAVGDGNTEPLAARWNGSIWALESTPKPSGATSSALSGVSCTYVTACTAIGYSNTPNGIEATLAERYSR
jgi:hypothetical protein